MRPMTDAEAPRKQLAERVGFEPTVRFNTDNALAGRPIRPLWHLSWTRSVYGAFPDFLTGISPCRQALLSIHRLRRRHRIDHSLGGKVE